MDIPKSLLEISQKVGADKLLVQGPGGNISYKNDNILYIKSSGQKLVDAKKRNIFVKTDLDKILYSIVNDKEDPLDNSWDTEGGLKPSIETTLHALMPFKCVLHVHCVNTISWLVRKDFYNSIVPLLKGIKWEVVKYKKPGKQLTNAVREVVKNDFPEVILLSNHGLVAGSNSPEEVYQLVKNISNRLAVKPNLIPDLNHTIKSKYIIDTGYKLPQFEELHKLAFSKQAISIITGGVLFPDQAVFLGTKWYILNDEREINNLKHSNSFKKGIIIFPNKGILIPFDFQLTEEELLYSILLIVQRIPSNTDINYLTDREENELLNWNAEKYRKLINK
ncbi:class II aldolase [Prochlorococcus marinus XMU1412]|uniref:class II aldolase/adducin family protein n=1 Tax=Prochlorococcus marinus TaxID=1219 RepID=UPI001ADA767B|nr:class II aldolase/adducin family protein [Prochlorococcus marinus]MBO8240544.1 class II aldolase [Prochlorococcus marinus XMU1412]